MTYRAFWRFQGTTVRGVETWTRSLHGQTPEMGRVRKPAENLSFRSPGAWCDVESSQPRPLIRRSLCR